MDNHSQLVGVLHRLDQLKFIHPAGVMPLAQEALALAKLTQTPDAQAKAVSYIAWAHTLDGNPATGVEYATQALLLAQEHVLPREEVRALGMLGAALLSVSLNDEAMACYQRAEEIATEYNYPDSMGLTLNDLGLIALNRHQPEHALVLFERGLELIPVESGGGMARAILLLNLGSTSSQIGHYAEAEAYLRRAIDLISIYPPSGLLAGAYVELGQNAFRQTDHAKAREFYGLALPLVENPPIPRLQIQIEMVWARLERTIGDVNAAILHLEGARAAAYVHNRRHALVGILDMLVELYTLAGNKLNSLACDQEALKLRAALNHEEIEARLTILRNLYTLRERMDIPLDVGDGGTALDVLLDAERERIERQKQQELAVFRDRVAHRIAHELRNPLAIIRSSGEMLKQYSEQMSEEKRQQHLDQIMAGTQRMTGLITDILDLLDTAATKETAKDD